MAWDRKVQMEALVKARELFPNLDSTQDVATALAAMDEMPTEAPAEEDPDAFHEGHAFAAVVD